MPRQSDLAREAKLQQSRISMFETPGAANMTIETLSRLAATFKVGLIVEFVSFSEMLSWENNFSQDSFDVIRLEQDRNFLQDRRRDIHRRSRRRRSASAGFVGISQNESAMCSTIATSVQLSFFNRTSPPSDQLRKLAPEQTELGATLRKWPIIDRTAEGKGQVDETGNIRESAVA